MTGLVTNGGLADVMAAWAAQPFYIQYGTGSGQDATANDLAAPVQARSLAVTSIETVTVTGDTMKVMGSIAAEIDRTITEVGAFDASGGGSMDIYGDFTGINIAAGDVIAFSIRVTAS